MFSVRARRNNAKSTVIISVDIISTKNDFTRKYGVITPAKLIAKLTVRHKDTNKIKIKKITKTESSLKSYLAEIEKNKIISSDNRIPTMPAQRATLTIADLFLSRDIRPDDIFIQHILYIEK